MPEEKIEIRSSENIKTFQTTFFACVMGRGGRTKRRNPTVFKESELLLWQETFRMTFF
ncbi:nitroreductase [Neisseria macacae ATCC 33926]|uniref:Nitroreductase n=1 Tax=Neisseria macacae ATCC 33926 TaxID=997348 RepID=A0AA36UGZ8_9NEIS|nr:nitroreductase [Neisseria macacae ATCC 33926]